METLFLERPRDGLAGRDGHRAGLMAGSFNVVKRNAFATGRERVGSFFVLEDVIGVRAESVVKGSVRRPTITSDQQFRLCALCVGSRTDFEVSPINQTIAIQYHLSQILLRAIRPKRATISLAASVDPTEACCADAKGIAMCGRPPFKLGQNVRRQTGAERLARFALACNAVARLGSITG
jgi:hypothetical protein